MFEVNPIKMNELRKEVYPFKSNLLEVAGYQMHYVDECKDRGGNESKENKDILLMVHGNPTWSFLYRDMIKELSQNFRCLAIDHIGCGLSDRSESFLTLEDRVDHLSEFIRKLDLKNVHLVGHDWGGAIGLGALLKNKERFKTINLFNTGAFISKDIPSRIAICRLPFIGTFLNRRLNLFAKAATFMASKRSLKPLEKQGYLLPYEDFSDRRAVDDFVQDIPMEEDHPTYEYMKTIETTLASVELPKQLIWGLKDFCFNKKFHDRFKQIWPDAHSTLIEDAGHYVFEDNKDLCLRKIREFIS